MIHIQDHLDSSASFIPEDAIGSNQLSEDCNCEIIDFPSDPKDDISNEELGKWVDQLMDIPEPEGGFSDPMDTYTSEFDDPMTQVAEKILSDDSF